MIPSLAAAPEPGLLALIAGGLLLAIAVVAVLSRSLRRSDLERWRTRQGGAAHPSIHDRPHLGLARREELARLLASLQALHRYRRRHEGDARTVLPSAPGLAPPNPPSPPASWALGGALHAEIGRLHANLAVVAACRYDAEREVVRPAVDGG
jgi:hypothetical protein